MTHDDAERIYEKARDGMLAEEHDAGHELEWLLAREDCVICGHVATAVFPATCTALECNGCGYMMAVPDDAEPFPVKDWRTA